MILLDTHAFIWLLNDDPQLGRSTRKMIEQASAESAVALAAITPWEVALLCVKGRLDLGLDVGEWLEEALARPGFRLLPLDPSIAVASVRLPGSFHPDPADRFIVATARHHRIPVVTVDRAIIAYGTDGHVQVLDAAL